MTMTISLRTKLHDASPIFIAFFFTGISIGALSFHSHISAIQSFFLLGLVLAGPLVIALLHAMTQNTDILSVIALCFIVNFRFVLMSASLLPYFAGISRFKLLIHLSYLASSTFTIPFLKFKHHPEITPTQAFEYYCFIGLITLPVFLLSVLIGFFLLQSFNSLWLTSFLIMMLPVHFTALTAKHLPKLRPVFATLLGFLTMPLLNLFTPQFALILTPLIIGFLFLMIRNKFIKKSGKSL